MSVFCWDFLATVYGLWGFVLTFTTSLSLIACCFEEKEISMTLYSIHHTTMNGRERFTGYPRWMMISYGLLIFLLVATQEPVQGFLVATPLPVVLQGPFPPVASTSSFFTTLGKPKKNTYHHPRHHYHLTSMRLFAELPDISKMKATEMKKELESYGISTKSLFEKPEFEDALRKARAEGRKPKDTTAPNGSGATTGSGRSQSSSASSSSSSSSSTSSTSARDQRYAEALEKAKTMKVSELKKDLQSRGVSTVSFFEKSEFEKAYAEAVADNKAGSSGPTGSTGSSSRRPAEEKFDPSYRDVVMQKIDRRQLAGQRVIDVNAAR